MRSTILIIALHSLLFISLHAQDVILYQFDFKTKETTEINLGTPILEAMSDATVSQIGTGQDIIQLNFSTPSDNFSRLEYAGQTNSFPISTSVKLNTIIDGEDVCACSGTMISKRHILTAAHCFVESGTNDILVDSIIAYPAYQDGKSNQDFRSHLIKKMYSFDNWNLNGNDFVILELDNETGLKTGWLGIGYENDDDELQNNLYHKFSYPCRSSFTQQGEQINGDTLYYSYGIFDQVDEFISSSYPDPPGFEGESGSSIFISDNSNHVIYGVATYAAKMSHSRIDDWEYWAILKIIEPQLNTSTIEIENSSLKIYPNPTKDYILLESDFDFDQVQIFDGLGNLMLTKNIKPKTEIELTNFPNGMYFIEVRSRDKVEIGKLLKCGS